MRLPLISLGGRSSRDCVSVPHSHIISRAFFLGAIKPAVFRVPQSVRDYHHERSSFCAPVRRPNHVVRAPGCPSVPRRNFVSSTAPSAKVVEEETQFPEDAQQGWQVERSQSEDAPEQLQSEDGWETSLDNLSHPASAHGHPASSSPLESSPRPKPLSREELVETMRSHLFDSPVPSSVYGPMVDAIREARELGLPDKGPGYVPETLWEAAPSKRPLNTNYMQRQSPIMIKDLLQKRQNPRWEARLRERLKLPVMAGELHKKLVTTLKNCDVLVIPGSTGSGKSTQVPQIILDYAIHEGKGGYTNVICSQPRRISAVSVARRVADERCEPMGHTVGYHVRFSDTLPKKYGGILYCTGGILWNYLVHRPSDIMDNYSHIMVDEVHERSTEIDLILMTLRNLVHERRANGLRYPKIVLMSATLKSEDFIRYFSESLDGQPGLRTASLEIPGRLYPIEETYLDTLLPTLSAQEVPAAISDLMKSPETKTYVQQEIHSPGPATEEQVVRDYFVPPELTAAATVQVFSATNSGDILVFLPGMSDIDKTAILLEQNRPFLESQRSCAGVKIFKLHSHLTDTNDQVFDEIPEGWRRIVLSSNIAETSVTLPGVTHVIDTGTMKLSTQDTVNELRELRCRWASKQNIQQRRGRAGRMRPGNYHALFSRARLDMFDEHMMPEIQRTDLARTALMLKTMAKPQNIKEGLSRVPDQPVDTEITGTIRRLQRAGALTDDEEVTPLGRAMSIFPTSPAGSKALILGVLFRCLEPMIVASITDSEALDQRFADGSSLLKSRYLFAQGSGSNSIATYNTFKEFREAIDSDDMERQTQLVSQRGIRRDMFRFLGKSARQICQQLHDTGLAYMPTLGDNFFPDIPPELNANAGCQPLVKALLMLSTETEMAARWSRHTFFGSQGLMLPAFRSVNDFVPGHVQREQIGTRVPQRGDLTAYAHARTTTDSKRLMMVQTSMVTPLMAILFSRTVEKLGDTHLKLNDSINLNVVAMNDSPTLPLPQAVNLTMEFRKMLDRLLQLAFSDLCPAERGQEKRTNCNKLFGAEHELRDKLTESLVQILNQDASMETTMLEQRYVVWEEEDNLRLKRLAEQASTKDRATAAWMKATKKARAPDNEAGPNSQKGFDLMLKM